MTGQGYHFLGGPNGGIDRTRLIAKMYLGGLIIISSLKIAASIYVVMFGEGANWTLAETPFGEGYPVGRCVDLVWMVFNAVLPLLISYVRMQNEAPLEINITCPNWDEYLDISDETKPLTGGGAGSHKKYEMEMTAI